MAIAAAMDVFSGYAVEGGIQHIVKTWGDGRTFAGHIHCHDTVEGGQWRYYVRRGKVISVEPTLMWPDEDSIGRQGAGR